MVNNVFCYGYLDCINYLDDIPIMAYIAYIVLMGSISLMINGLIIIVNIKRGKYESEDNS